MNFVRRIHAMLSWLGKALALKHAEFEVWGFCEQIFVGLNHIGVRKLLGWNVDLRSIIAKAAGQSISLVVLEYEGIVR